MKRIVRKYNEYIKENVEFKLDNKNGFFMFLKLLDELKMTFIKTNHYLLIGKYQYFFTTENIKNKDKTIDMFEDVISLRVLYKTFVENKEKRLSFYFGVKNYSFEYGLCDDMTNEVYMTGEFLIDNRFLRTIKSYKCIVLIEDILKRSNVKNLILLHEIRNHVSKYWYPEKGGKTIIMNDNILKKTVPKSEIGELTHDKILFKYEQWCEKYKWINKVFYYLDEEDNGDISFYIKIKEKNKIDKEV